jgi:hypothetical protein
MDEVKKVEGERVIPPVNVAATPIAQVPKPVVNAMTVAEATVALSKAKAAEAQRKMRSAAEAADLKRKGIKAGGPSAADKDKLIADKTAAAQERVIAETKKLDGMYKESPWTIINYICKTCGRASTSVDGARKHARTHL